MSAAFLNNSRHPRPVKSLRRELEGACPILRVPPEVWVDRIKRLAALRDLVARHVDQAREKQMRKYNEDKRDVQFSAGDLVMRRTHPLSSGINKFSAKLAPKYEGLFKIVEIKSPIVYILESVSGDTRHTSEHGARGGYAPPLPVPGHVGRTASCPPCTGTAVAPGPGSSAKRIGAGSVPRGGVTRPAAKRTRCSGESHRGLPAEAMSSSMVASVYYCK